MFEPINLRELSKVLAVPSFRHRAREYQRDGPDYELVDDTLTMITLRTL
ncbi:hypothetical protein [Nocardia sp. NPDC057440]